jgi:hypothetical protein
MICTTPFLAMIFVFTIFAVLAPFPKPEIVATVEAPEGRVIVVRPPETMVRLPLTRSEENVLP